MDGMKSNLLQMPHRCAEAMWEERQLRAAHRRELQLEREAHARFMRGIRYGLFFTALIGVAIYLIVK